MNDDHPVDTPVNAAPAKASDDYRVLARKYRPTTFSGLIGQEAMVRTLTNAFKTGRLAHAFILTGVRGIGKTSTARIVARALNCVGPDGTGEPTTEPCGVCEHCRAIAEDRHVDVLEMDAASRTGVDDIRELIDGVRYRPTSARYKVYIIDEVHMLSKNAFNALLKTLEEPPEHVKFIFATTEIRKVPVTVLSRCQRFDLRRVDVEGLGAHFRMIADKEKARIDDAALHLIARAADGSVRDGLSLLDQAISQAEGAVDEIQVRDMLGLADRGQTFQLLEATFKGDIAASLDMLAGQYHDGADPAAVLEDMLEIVHWLTRIKIVPEAADAPDVPEIERRFGKDLSERLAMPDLARAWQMLLKGLGEVRAAPIPLSAAEMILVRLAYTSDLPTPEDALKATPAGGGAPASKPAAPPAPTDGGARMTGTGDAAQTATAPQTAPETVTDPAPEAAISPRLATFEDIVALAAEVRDQRLRYFLEHHVRLVRFEPGQLEFQLAEGAPTDMVQALRKFLDRHAADPWTVTVSNQTGAETLAEHRDATAAAEFDEAARHPLVQAVMETFPGARIDSVRHLDREDAGNDATMTTPDEETADPPDL